MRTERVEHTDLPLDLVEGQLPADLAGHLYVVAPARTISGDETTTLTVGDGLLCRFDLSPNGVALTTRLVKGPDYFADELTAADPALAELGFVNSGMVRLGLLGSRNFSNTALVPMKKGAEPTRMLVTYDAGRPVEVDPKSLAYATPVGHRDEWDAEALPGAVFPTVLSPAHPAWDGHTGELFTLGYGRGVGSFAATIPSIGALMGLPRRILGAADALATVFGVDRAFHFLVRHIKRAATQIDLKVEDVIASFVPHLVPDSFTELVRWDGQGALQRYRLVLESEREVHVRQSVHQVAVTKDHVVILETGFKIGMQSAFNNPLPDSDVFERLARYLLTERQLPYTVFYVLKRADLDLPLPPTAHGLPRVACKRIQVPLEADHFLADYDDADGITLHVGHAPATDLSEWIRPYDVSAYDGEPIDPALHGMLAVGAMDVGRFGRYVIDADSGELLSSRTLVDERTSWAIALYAGQGLNTPDPAPQKIEQLYWCTEGVFPELLTEFVKDLYRDYPHRLVDVKTILSLGQSGRPSAIHRVDTASMTFADTYALPAGVMAGSLQFVPTGTGPTDGYLVGTMYTMDRTELWVFDAADLAAGPVAKLASPKWNVGFSLHTAWLPSLEARTASYKITPREEIGDAVQRLSPTLAARFEQALYPQFD